MELSKTAYVILGMLRTRAHTGYEIKSIVDHSTRFFWAASYGQIYPELKRLEDAGLVEGESVPQDGRRRRAYSLTPAGRQALKDWLTSGEPLHSELRHEGLLRFFFADVIDPHEQLALVRTMREMHERIRGELVAVRPKAEEARDARGQEFPLRTLQHGIAYQDFVVEWCSQLERELAGDRDSLTTGS
jgi:DNA-binding PadR family transcriptional regulator